jgi:sigma-B regulation protein RsbU (phosphoserine phosphatase)
MKTTKSDPLDQYIQSIVHSWSKTLAALGVALIPAFFILDYFMMPPEHLTRFAIYRVVTTAIVVAQYFVLRGTRPGPTSILHGYFFSLVTSEMIVLMTVYLGGFNSTYYAGLNLVMIAVNLMLPWRPLHSAINSALIIALYVVTNVLHSAAEPINALLLINNFYFLISTAIISVAINWVKERLIRQEFLSRSDLQTARDSLWSEMAVAKRIQTSLLPRVQRLAGCRVAAIMVPAEEVGGDYYDVIQNDAGEIWISIGDVSGHGVESGLIMMMTQTSIFTAVNKSQGLAPSMLLDQVNSVLTENIARLGTDRYMTLSAIVLRDDQVVFAGKHQDILIYRHATGQVEAVPTEGTWLGVVESLRGCVPDRTVTMADDDVALLFTDGVTEATNRIGRMYGEADLSSALARNARLDVEAIVTNIAKEVRDHMHTQADDFTLLVFKKDRQALAARGT